MKIVSLQSSVATGDTETNVKTFSEMTAEAVGDSADVVVLPEMWATGFDYLNLNDHAERSNLFIQRIQDLLRQDVLAVLSLPEYENGRIYNTVFAVSKSNVIAKYRKTFLFSPMKEDRHFSRGSGDSTVFNFKGCRFSLHTCYEIRFPELFRLSAYNGTDVMLVPAIWPESKREHWSTLLRARAIENQCFVVGCNASEVKSHVKTLSCGYSVTFDPWGEDVGSLKNETGLLAVNLNLAKVSEIRSELPSLKDAKAFFEIDKK